MHAASLNHVFRLVWSDRLMAWVPAAEGTSARGKAGRSGAAARVAQVVLGAAAASFAGGALAGAGLPTGGQVVQGTGQIATSGNTMTVTQGSARLVTNWQSFSIGNGQTVRFVQPSATSVALNRVLGSEVSNIQGSLQANGQVFLLNPNGVLFSPSAQVNVGGLLASTLNLSDTDFMAGRYALRGDSTAAVVNEGAIQAVRGGNVALVAATVRNTGSVQADGGFVGLASGQDVTVDFGGSVKLQVNRGAVDSLIENGGAIRADGGRVFFTAKAADALSQSVINQTGVVRARTLSTGARGEILLIGDMDHGTLNAGGTLDASAPEGGNGGFIETSAAHVNTLGGLTVNAGSRLGLGGEWLIDPYDYTIGVTAASNIMAALNTGTSVTVTTQSSNTNYGGSASNTGVGNITVSSAITKTAGGNATLTLRADQSIVVNQAITSTAGQLGITLSSANNASSNLGGVAVNANLNSNGGRILIGGAGGNQTAATHYGIGYALNSSTTSAAVQIGTNVSILSGGGDITINGRSGATASGSYNPTRGGVYVLSGATVDTGGGNLFLSGISSAASNVFGFGVEANSNTVTTFKTGSSRGVIVMDAQNLINADGALGLVNSGSQANVKFWAPSVAHMLFRINGNNKATTFTKKPPCEASFPNCGTMVIPGSNGSYLYAFYNVVSEAMQPIYVSTGSATRTYDSTTNASGLTFTALGGPTGFNVTSLGTLSFSTPSKNVGSYTSLTPSASNPGEYTSGGTLYAVAYFNQGTYTITPKAITSFTAANKVYDGTLAANVTGSGIYGGDAVTVNATGGFASANVGTGIAVNVTGVSLSGADAGNYTVSGSGTITTTADITKAPLTVTANNATRVYDGNAYSGGNGVTYTGFVNGETDSVLTGTLAYGGTSQGAVNAGSYTITASGLDASNYQLTFLPGALTIKPATLAVITGNLTGVVSKVYDGNDTATLTSSNYQLSGWVGGDGATVTKTTGTYANANAGSGKLVTVSLAESDFSPTGSTQLSNYELPTSVSGYVGVITPAPLTITATAARKTYDGTAAAGAPTVSGLKGGDSASAVQSYLDSLAGTGKTVRVTSHTINDGNNGDNYTVSLVDSTAGIIDKASATVTASARTVTYNGSTQTQSAATLSGFLNGDDITVGGLASGRNAGTYTSNLTVGGTAAGNYDVTFTNADLLIQAAPLTITATAARKTYDGTTTLLGAPTITGLLGGDTASAVQAFVTGQAGTGKSVQVTSRTINDGNSGNNYTVSLVDSTAGIIDKASATVTASARTVTYNGGTQTQNAATLSGFLDGDDITVGGLASARNAGTYTSNLTVGGTAAGNYDVTFTNANLLIQAAPLTITATAARKTYDGTTTVAGAPTITGLLGGDTASAVQAFVTGQAGTGKTVQVTSRTVNDGNGGNNYTVTLVDSTGGIIDKASATVTASARTVTYNGSTQTQNAATLSGFLSGDDISVSGLASARNAGTYASSLTVGGTAAGNYEVTLTNANLQILPATLTLSVVPVSRAAGVANPVFTADVRGFVGLDTLGTATAGSLTFATQAGVGAQAGAYAVVAGGLTALHGNYVFVQDPANGNALTVTAPLPAVDRFLPRAAAVPNFPDNATPALTPAAQPTAGNLNYVSLSSTTPSSVSTGSAGTAPPVVVAQSGSGASSAPTGDNAGTEASVGTPRAAVRMARPGVAGTAVPSANGPLDIFVVDGGINGGSR